jgi:preprotein translocase subunit SecE
MNKVRLYFKETSDELVNKVSWPTWSELQSSTLIVMVASCIIAALVFAMDSGFQFLMNTFYSLFK